MLMPPGMGAPGLDPLGLGAAMPPMPGLGAPMGGAMLSEFQRLDADYPPAGSELANKIAQAEAVPGNVRHDILVDKGLMGHLIGAGGKKHKEMTTRTACAINIMDKECPPGAELDQRLVILVGTPYAVTAAALEIMDIVAKNDQDKQPQTQVITPDPALVASMTFTKRPDGWAESTNDGPKIAAAEAMPGSVRHDQLVPKDMCGVLIGTKGAAHKQLCQSSGSKVFILDKVAPPGESPDDRLVIFVGMPECVTSAYMQVHQLISTATEKRGQKRGFEDVGGAAEDYRRAAPPFVPAEGAGLVPGAAFVPGAVPVPMLGVVPGAVP